MNAHPERFTGARRCRHGGRTGDAPPDGERLRRRARASKRCGCEGVRCDRRRDGPAWPTSASTAPSTAWQAMFDDIATNGAATGRQTINSLACSATTSSCAATTRWASTSSRASTRPCRNTSTAPPGSLPWRRLKGTTTWTHRSARTAAPPITRALDVPYGWWEWNGERVRDRAPPPRGSTCAPWVHADCMGELRHFHPQDAVADPSSAAG